MDRKLGERVDRTTRDEAFDLDTLLHPAQAFEHPSEIVNDPDLTLNEKRAILASWASDACAVEAAPALRQRPGARSPVTFDEIMDALRTLDEEARAHQPRVPKYKSWLGSFKGRKRTGDGDLGSFG